METENRIKGSDYPGEEELKAAYEKGRRVGRLEGMIAYQQRLVKNLAKDNENLNAQLQEAMK